MDHGIVRLGRPRLAVRSGLALVLIVLSGAARPDNRLASLPTRLARARVALDLLDQAVSECQRIRETTARIKALNDDRQKAAAHERSCRAMQDRLWPGQSRNNQTRADYRAVVDQRTRAAAAVAELDSQLIELKLRDISPNRVREVELLIRTRTETLKKSLRNLRATIKEVLATPKRQDGTLAAAHRFVTQAERYLKALKRG